MQVRTDLALEQRELLGAELPQGVRCEEESGEDWAVTRIFVDTPQGAERMGKPQGAYITVEVPPFQQTVQLLDGRLDALVQELRRLLPESGTVLVVGIGNSDITPDALGPKTAELIFATRHIGAELAESAGLGKLRQVSGLAPGVLGRTGIETGEIVAGLVAAIRPDAVITVDALAARRLSRLGNTVQLSDAGIVPGSGVGNARKELSRATLGVPVIAIGVPTVVDAVTLTIDMLAQKQEQSEGEEQTLREMLGDEAAQMMVTPREVDLMVERASKLIAMAINCATQPQLSAEDLLMLVG